MEPKQNTRRPAAKKKSKRGGRRPGAGAPRGNWNALKTGAYSRQFAELGRLLATDPRIRAVLLDVAARAGHKFKTANEEAAYLLIRWAERVEKRAEAKYAPKARKRRAKKPVLSSAEGPVLSSVEGPVLSSAEGLPLSSAEGADRLTRELPVDDWDSIKQAAANYERKMRK